MARRPALLLVATLVPACAPPPSDDDGGAEALRLAAEAYHAAASAKDAAGVVALYDEGAVMIPPGGEMVNGLDEVRGYRFGFISTPGVSLSFELARVEVSASGDMGWTLALGDITIQRPDGTTGKDLVRDFHVWRRQADGSWKVVVDAWNSGPPPGS